MQRRTTHSKYNYLFLVIGFIIVTIRNMTTVKAEGTPAAQAPSPAPTNKDTPSVATEVTKPKTRTKPSKWNNNSRTTAATLFKGATPELSGKIFISGPSQAARYDDTYKALLHYFNNKYDYRIYKAFEMKDKDAGLTLITRPTAPTVKKIVQEATKGKDSKMVGVEKEVLDRDSDKFYEYQEEMKRYVSDKTHYNRDMQNCFHVIIGQCSPAILQNLESEETYDDIKRSSDSIELMKLIEKMCYNYKPHEYSPLGA